MDNKTNKYEGAQNMEKNSGLVSIADDVIAMIAALAVTEVEGVYCLNENLRRDNINKASSATLAKAVKVEKIGETKVKIDCAVIMKYGYNVPDTSRRIQEKVVAAIDSMACKEVTDVNIRITGVRQ